MIISSLIFVRFVDRGFPRVPFYGTRLLVVVETRWREMWSPYETILRSADYACFPRPNLTYVRRSYLFLAISRVVDGRTRGFNTPLRRRPATKTKRSPSHWSAMEPTLGKRFPFRYVQRGHEYAVQNRIEKIGFVLYAQKLDIYISCIIFDDFPWRRDLRGFLFTCTRVICVCYVVAIHVYAARRAHRYCCACVLVCARARARQYTSLNRDDERETNIYIRVDDADDFTISRISRRKPPHVSTCLLVPSKQTNLT